MAENAFAPSKTARPASWPLILFLSTVFLLVTGWNMSIQQIEKPDEPRYVCAGRDLVLGDRSPDASDWVIPMFNGEPRLKKPVLIYWVLAAAGSLGQVFGVELATAFRAVPILSGLLAMLAAFGMARRLFGERAGLMAALILLSTYFYHTIVREIIIDPMLTAALIGSWYFFVCGLQHLAVAEVRAAGLPFLGMYICMGLACLAKGPPLVAIFAVIPMAAYLFWDRSVILEFPENGGKPSRGWMGLLGKARVWYGAPLALFIGLFWFFVLWRAGEWNAVEIIIWGENIQRAAGNVDHNSGVRLYPFVFYVQNVPLHFLPWALLFLPAWWWTLRQRSVSSRGKLLGCALVIPWTIMGVVGSKRSVYMLPLYPLLAIWLGWAWDCVFLSQEDATRTRSQPSKGLVALWKYVLIVIATLPPVALCAVAILQDRLAQKEGLRFSPQESSLAILLALGLIAQAAWTISELLKGKRWQPSMQVLMMVAVLGFAQEAILRPVQERKEDKAAFFGAIQKCVGARPLIWLGGSGNEGSWYLRRVIHEVLPWKGLREKFYESRKKAVLLIRGKEFKGKRGRRMGLINESVTVLQELSYGGKPYFLVEPDPDTKPNPNIFERPKRKGPIPEDVPWYKYGLPILLIGIFCGVGYHARRADRNDNNETETQPPTAGAETSP